MIEFIYGFGSESLLWANMLWMGLRLMRLLLSKKECLIFRSTLENLYVNSQGV